MGETKQQVGRALRPTVTLQQGSIEREDGTWLTRLESTPTVKFFELVSPRGMKLRLQASVVGPTSCRVAVLFHGEASSNAPLFVLGSTTVPLRSDLLGSVLSILLEAITSRFASGLDSTTSPTEKPAETPASEEPGIDDTDVGLR